MILPVLVFAVRNPRRLAVDSDKARLEALVRLPLRVEQRVERPVLHRLECTDLALALDNQAHGHGLHASRRKSAADLIPQQRRNLVAHQPVKNAARLLRVDEILIHIAGMLERFLHSLLGDLVEGDAANLLPLLGRCA